jgi:hypothetical protein
MDELIDEVGAAEVMPLAKSRSGREVRDRGGVIEPGGKGTIRSDV